MQIFDNPDITIPNKERGIGLGFFDGVHRGHLELLRTLIFECRQVGLPAAVFTFPRHPEAVLHPDAPFDQYLSTLDERMTLLSDSGLDETHLCDFNAAFADIEPEQFLNEILVQRLQARLIVVGHDYRFGRHGAGDVRLLASWAENLGIKVIVLDEVCMHGGRISSSRIRLAVETGDMPLASSLLGRPYSISGSVVSGRQLGRRLGFPTANIVVESELVCPAFGVYATRARVGNRTYNAITNVGLRPTVDTQSARPLIETYIYDLDADLYGQTIRIEFLQMIRPERQFETIELLGCQVSEDLLTVRTWHERAEICHEKARVNNIPLFLLQTGRFAQASLNLIFLVPIEKRKSSALALLMRTLTASCRSYPSRIELAAALDSLYGASIDANLEKQGDLQVINLAADALIRWTDGSSPFREVCTLLFDLLLEPRLDENGNFDEATVETERQNLILEIDARENDRGKYSYDRCLAGYCGDQPQGLSPIGDRQALLEVSLDDLRQTYHELLHSTAIRVFLGGNINPDVLDTCIQGISRLPATTRPDCRPAEYPSPFSPAAPSGHHEHKAVEQARLALAYTGLPPYFSHRAIVATVLNSMLGGDVHSLLFDVVREKMGLAYSVFSMNQRSLSSIFILAGVAADQITPALSAVRQQVEALAAGNFEPSLFERSRQMIETSILSASDELSTLMAHQVIGQLYGRVMSRDESLSLLKEVSPAEISKMAGQLRLVTCYVLSGPDQKPDLTAAGLPENARINDEVKP